MNLRDKIAKSAPVRKGKSALNRLPRALSRLQAREVDYETRPPIVVNSLPKSGTHLMMQLAEVLPGAMNYGTFLAQTPSLTLKERSQSQINARIAALAPGEVVGAHLYYHLETAAALRRRNALHLFIWRDPRDVLLSEAHYLAEMARFHALHSTFRKIEDPDARVRLAISGDGSARYPDAAQRILPYMGWRDDSDTLVFRYEMLSDLSTQESEIARLADGYLLRSGAQSDRNALIGDLISAIDPHRSHTFHKGGRARWKSEMTAENQALIQKILDGTGLLTDLEGS